MTIDVTLRRADRPNGAMVKLSFPMEDGAMMRELELIGVGNSLTPDCHVLAVEKASGVGNRALPVLQRLRGTNINVDEFNYLARRLDSFTQGEIDKFQAAVDLNDICELKKLINLTFNLDSYTVITNFSDLAGLGRMLYLDQHGGLGPVENQPYIDYAAVASGFISNQKGTVTPYGVVYDHGLEMDEAYDGRLFPDYDYTNAWEMHMAVTNRKDPSADLSANRGVCWLYLPVSDCWIEKTLLRLGADSLADLVLECEDSQLTLPFEVDNLRVLNDLCWITTYLDSRGHDKFEAAIELAEPKTLEQALNLAKGLDLFSYVPDVTTPEEYGQYMIRESGHFEFDDYLDEQLEAFYNFKGYGEARIQEEQGKFLSFLLSKGYICYEGAQPLEDLLENGPEQQQADMTMG